jgi:hypothetical protein
MNKLSVPSQPEAMPHQINPNPPKESPQIPSCLDPRPAEETLALLVVAAAKRPAFNGLNQGRVHWGLND